MPRALGDQALEISAAHIGVAVTAVAEAASIVSGYTACVSLLKGLGFVRVWICDRASGGVGHKAGDGEESGELHDWRGVV